MFQQLKPLVAQSPLAMQVAGEGDQLRVTLQQKRAGKARAPLSLSILGTAEELDRDLPAAIAAAAAELTKPAPVAAQVKTQVDAARASANESAKKNQPKPAKKKKPARPVKARPAKPAKAPPLKQAAKPKHKAKPAARVKLPGKKNTPKAPHHPSPITHHSPSKAGVKHHASKPDQAACIADYKAMQAKHGARLNRELFIDKSATGRRFERLWGMSWRKFIEAAEGSRINVAAPRAAKAPVSSGGPARAAAAAPDSANAATPPEQINIVRDWISPLPEIPPPPADAREERDHPSAPMRAVKNADGVVLCRLQRFVNIGDPIRISRSTWVVTHYDNHTIAVEPAAPVEEPTA